MSNIAFLGLGAMGSRMAARLLAAGHDVTVWNRSPERAEDLRTLGAKVAPTPRAAVQGAMFVIAMVRDDDASRSVWLDAQTGALAGMMPGSVAVETSTLSLPWVRELASHCAQQGRAFIDAPVAGSRPQAEQGLLVFMVGGEAHIVASATPILSAMGGAVHHAGPAGAGAIVKLAVNSLFGVQVAAVAELTEMIRRQGFDPARAVEIIAATPVCSPAAKVAAGAMLANAFAPLFPVELVVKDFTYAQQAGGGGDQAPMIRAAGQVFQHALDRGFGGDNLTGIVRLYRP